MKKWLITAVIAMGVIFVAVMPLVPAGGLISVWGIKGLEQFNRVMPFVSAAICFLVPLALHLAHRWRQTHKPMSPVKEKTMNRGVTLQQIAFFLFGLGNLASGLGNFSILSLDLAFFFFLGSAGLGLLAMVAAVIVLWADPHSAKSEQQQTNRPAA